MTNAHRKPTEIRLIESSLDELSYVLINLSEARERVTIKADRHKSETYRKPEELILLEESLFSIAHLISTISIAKRRLIDHENQQQCAYNEQHAECSNDEAIKTTNKIESVNQRLLDVACSIRNSAMIEFLPSEFLASVELAVAHAKAIQLGSVNVPDGWALVPTKPTEGMLCAVQGRRHITPERTYIDMINAAPMTP